MLGATRVNRPATRTSQNATAARRRGAASRAAAIMNASPGREVVRRPAPAQAHRRLRRIEAEEQSAHHVRQVLGHESEPFARAVASKSDLSAKEVPSQEPVRTR